MINSPISRRKILGLLKGTAALTACSIIAPTILSGCQKRQPHDQGNNINDINATLPSPPDNDLCPTDNTLSEEEKARRKNLNYSDQTKIPTRTCDNCKLYKALAASRCGECTVVPGPIHPKGWCSSWYYRM